MSVRQVRKFTLKAAQSDDSHLQGSKFSYCPAVCLGHRPSHYESELGAWICPSVAVHPYSRVKRWPVARKCQHCVPRETMQYAPYCWDYVLLLEWWETGVQLVAAPHQEVPDLSGLLENP
jgi:hypothetical protein